MRNLADGRTFQLPRDKPAVQQCPDFGVDGANVVLTGNLTQPIYSDDEVLFDFVGEPFEVEVEETVRRKVWAALRDFHGRDIIQYTIGGLLTIGDSRYIVRAGLSEWNVRDTFLDEENYIRTVRGVSQIGRSRYLELLVRRIG